MAQNDDIPVSAGVWTLLSNSDITAIRVHNLSGYAVRLQAAAGAIPPISTRGSMPLPAGETLAADLTLAQLWPGVVGANRLYAYADLNLSLSVSHA